MVAACLQDGQIDCPECAYGVVCCMAQAVPIHLAASIAMLTIGLQRRLDDMHQEGTLVFGGWDDKGESERRHQDLHGLQTCMEHIGRMLLSESREEEQDGIG